jgi:hypothetical protein
MFSLKVNDNRFNIHYLRIHRESFRLNDLVLCYFEDYNDAIDFSEKSVGHQFSVDFKYFGIDGSENIIDEFVKMDCHITIASWESLDYLNNELKSIYLKDEYGLHTIVTNKKYYILLLEGRLLINHNVPSYNQYLVDVFFLWQNKIDINWEKLNGYHFKSSYILATSFYYGKCNKLNVSKDVIIDGNYIQDEWDVFYYLGEFLFGSKGFIGLGLDSMYDNLIDISHICDLSNIIINFTSSEKIRMSIGNEYFNRLIELLEEFKIKVVLSSA